MSKRTTKTCGIYRVTSPSGKVYIGQSVCIEERYSRYKNHSCSHQRKLHASILKYGFDLHIFDILHICSKEELNFWEKLYITLFASTGEYGLNIRTGGHEPKVTEESRKRMSDAHKGQVAWNKGKKGIQKAWNKGLTATYGVKIYQFIKNGEIVTIHNLKSYCIENNLQYASMISIANSGLYGQGKYKYANYKGYSKLQLLEV